MLLYLLFDEILLPLYTQNLLLLQTTFGNKMLIKEQIECRDYCHIILIAPSIGRCYTSVVGIAYSAQYNDSHNNCQQS